MRGDLAESVRGMSVWGYVWLLVGVAVVITLSLRIAPHYMNYRTVQTVIKTLETEKVQEMSRQQVYDLLKKRFKINSLYDFEPSKLVAVKRGKNETLVTVDYEVREPIVYNADVVLSFHEEFVFQ